MYYELCSGAYMKIYIYKSRSLVTISAVFSLLFESVLPQNSFTSHTFLTEVYVHSTNNLPKTLLKYFFVLHVKYSNDSITGKCSRQRVTFNATNVFCHVKLM